MHAAPPVRVSQGRHRGWALFVALCAGAAAANLVAWGLMHWEVPGAWLPATIAAVIAALLAAGWAQRGPMGGELRWDGAQWHWRDGAGSVAVAIDLHDWLLLRWQPPAGRPQWIALARSATEGPWPALRAALHAPAPAQPQDTPPA